MTMTKVDSITAKELRRRLHDINNSLNAIMMQAELIRLYAGDDRNNREIESALDTICRECRTAGSISRGSGELLSRLSD